MSSGAEASTRNWQRLIPLFILLLTIPFHVAALDGWWLWDDPQLVLHALRVDTADTLFDPAEYRTLAAHTFTPLLPVSLKLDVLIGGLDPTVAYVHQLIAMLLAGLLMDQLLRRYVDRWVAGFIAVAFLTSWMSVYAVRTLMIRHYVEGLVFMLAALILWSGRSGRGDRIEPPLAQRVAAATFWFLALLEKEIFALAPLLLILQRRANGSTWREVLRSLVEPAVAALLWLAWRTMMLGSIGGYADGVTARDLALLPLSLVRALAPPAVPWSGWLVIAIAAVLTTIALVRAPRRLGALAAFVAVAIIPVVTLADNFEWRYGFGASAIMFAGIGLAVSGLDATLAIQRGVAALVAVLSLVSAPFAASGYEEITRPIEMEGLWLWERDSDAPGMVASSPSWYLAGIRDMKNMMTAEGTPRFLCSTLPFAIYSMDPSAWVRWDPATRQFERLAPGVVQEVRNRRVHQRGISVVVERDADVLSWSFEAEENARWSFAVLPHFETWSVPPTGERRIPASEDLGLFVVIATWSDGSWTSSAELPFPRDDESTRWVVR